MKEMKKILAVVDPTVEEQPAVRRAAWLANNSRTRAACLLLQRISQRRPAVRFAVSRKPATKLSRITRSISKPWPEPLRADGIVVKTSAVWDHPLYEGIVRHIVESGADIVLKDTHHHSALTRALLTNTDWNLIRTCPVPLWLVKAHDMERAGIYRSHRSDAPARQTGCA